MVIWWLNTHTITDCCCSFVVGSWLQSLFPLWLLKKIQCSKQSLLNDLELYVPGMAYVQCGSLFLSHSCSHWSLLIVHVLCYVVTKQLHSNEILFTGWLSWWGSARIDNICFSWLNCPCSFGVIMLVVILSVHIGAHNSKTLSHIIFTILVWEFETLCVLRSICSFSVMGWCK